MSSETIGHAWAYVILGVILALLSGGITLGIGAVAGPFLLGMLFLGVMHWYTQEMYDGLLLPLMGDHAYTTVVVALPALFVDATVAIPIAVGFVTGFCHAFIKMLGRESTTSTSDN